MLPIHQLATNYCGGEVPESLISKEVRVLEDHHADEIIRLCESFKEFNLTREQLLTRIHEQTALLSRLPKISEEEEEEEVSAEESMIRAFDTFNWTEKQGDV